MKKVNLTIIATIIATFVISIFAIQPTTIEASNNVSPKVSATPRKIKVKRVKGFSDVSGLSVEPIERKRHRKHLVKKGYGAQNHAVGKRQHKP